MKFKKIITTEKDCGKRLDLLMTAYCKDISRSQIQKIIKENGGLSVDGKKQKPSYIVSKYEEINYDTNLFLKSKPNKLQPSTKALNIIYEDNNYIAINKEANVSVHGVGERGEETLVNRLISYCPKIKKVTFDNTSISKIRPGVVHRLDKNTTGVIIFAKNIDALKYLSTKIKNREVDKKYYAIISGWIDKNGKLLSKISRDKKNRLKMTESNEGKLASCHYKAINYYQTNNNKIKITLVEIKLVTGRTHQIRVQFKGAGYPLIGDKLYNTKESILISKILGAKRQMLHSKAIEFKNMDNKTIKITAEQPDDFCGIINKLKIVQD